MKGWFGLLSLWLGGPLRHIRTKQLAFSVMEALDTTGGPGDCWSVPRLSLRFYSLKPTFVTCDGSTNRKWHRSLSIWLQQVRQRWWAGHFDSIIWVACHFAEDVSTYQGYVALYQEHVWTHWTKLLQRSINIWQVALRRGDNVSGRACNLLTSRKMLQRIRNVLQGTWRRCCKIPGTSFKGLEEDLTTSCKWMQVSPSVP